MNFQLRSDLCNIRIMYPLKRNDTEDSCKERLF